MRYYIIYSGQLKMFVRRGMRGFGRLLTYDFQQAKRFSSKKYAEDYRLQMDDAELWVVREVIR